MAYLSLVKPRVLLLLLFASFTAMLLAKGSGLSPYPAALTLLGGGLAAASANVLNNYYDRFIDTRMARTRKRALPAGRVAPRRALLWGLGLGAGGVTLLLIMVNWQSALLAGAGIGFYVIVYTLWLKKRTPYNIVIGGLAGAFPPLVGWVGVAGTLSLLPIIMAALIILWTPPHFWSLALYHNRDYRQAQIPMLPVIKGEQATKQQILGYSVILVGVSFIPFFVWPLGYVYLIMAAILGGGLIMLAWQNLYGRQLAYNYKFFRFSNIYLGLLFMVLILGKVFNDF